MIDVVAHFLAGLLSALAVLVNPVLSVLGFLIFWLYELNEELHLKDAFYEELREYACGFFLGVVILLVLRLA